MQVLTTAPWGAVMQTRGHHTHQWSPDIQNTKEVIHRQIQSQMQKLTIECRKPSKGQTNIPGSNIHTLTHPFVFNFPRSLSWLFHHRFLASAHSFWKRRKCQVFTHGDYCWCGIAIQGGSRIEKIFRRVYSELQVGILYSQYSIETHSSAIEFRTSSLLLHFNISAKETILFNRGKTALIKTPTRSWPLNWWINSGHSVQK